MSKIQNPNQKLSENSDSLPSKWSALKPSPTIVTSLNKSRPKQEKPGKPQNDSGVDLGNECMKDCLNCYRECKSGALAPLLIIYPCELNNAARNAPAP